ncbi:MAG TPA: PKD domain-containing protein [Fontimonas sp.]
MKSNLFRVRGWVAVCVLVSGMTWLVPQAWSQNQAYPLGDTEIWRASGSYGYSAYAPPIPDESLQEVGAGSEDDPVHEFKFAVAPGTPDLSSLKVKLSWALPGKDYLTLQVTAPDGRTSGSHYVNSEYQEAAFTDPMPGEYTVRVRESRTTGGDFQLAATVTRSEPVAVGGVFPPGFDPAADDVVVIAVIDSGINPYHWDFLASKMPQHLNSDVNDDLPLDRDPSSWVPGYPAPSAFKSFTKLDLTLEQQAASKSTAELHAADQAQWSKIQYSQGTLNKDVNMYWFPGTKVIGHVVFGGSALPGGSNAYDPWAAASHGVGSSSVSVGNIHGSCPNCLLVYVHGTSEEASQWVSKQDWIDLQTNSWGYSATLVVRDRIYAGSDTELQRRVTERGQSIFFSAGNGLENAFVAPNPTLFSSQEGPDWVITVGAIDTDGDAPGHGRPAEVSSLGGDYKSAYGGDGSVNAEGDFSGTSNATPVLAGLYGEALYQMRRSLAGKSRLQSNGVIAQGGAGCGAKNAQCALADGKISVHEMREAFFRAAQPTRSAYAPGAILPIPSTNNIAEWRYLSQGHGALFGRLQGVDAYTLEVERIGAYLLGLWAEEPSEDDRNWYVADSVCRQAMWGEWNHGYARIGVTPLPASDPDWPVRSWLVEGCPQTLPAVVELERLAAGDVDSSANDRDDDGAPNDADNCPAQSNTDQADDDGDGIGNVCDNCPSDSNANQADANGNGIGDACEVDSGGPGDPGEPLAVTLAATYSKAAHADGRYPVSPSDPLIVTFTATASGGGDSDYRYTFAFGDGSHAGPQAGRTAQHSYRYANGDGYHVKVTVTDAAATELATSQEILIRTRTDVVVDPEEPPAQTTDLLIDITPDEGVAPMKVSVDTLRSRHASGTHHSDYSFSFGDGSAVVTNQTGAARHVYTVPERRSYTIEVTLTDRAEDGSVLGTDSASQSIVVNAGGQLTAQLSVNPVRADIGDVITFDGCHSFAADGHKIVRFLLDPGDKSTPIEQIVGVDGYSCADKHADASVFSYAYQADGHYTPTLTVYDDAANSAKVSVGSVGIGEREADSAVASDRRSGGAFGAGLLLPLLLMAMGRRMRLRG